MTVLQHRGQDAAGIATADGGKLRVHKGQRLVRDVFDAGSMSLLGGRVGIAIALSHRAARVPDEAQPFYVNSPFGIALAHNGNLQSTPTRCAARCSSRTIQRQHRTDGSAAQRVRARAGFAKALTPDAVFRRAGVNRRAKGGYAVVCARCWAWAWSRSATRTASVRWCSASARARMATMDTSSPPSGGAGYPRLQRLRDVGSGRGYRDHRARGELFAQQCAPTGTPAASSSTCISRARTR